MKSKARTTEELIVIYVGAFFLIVIAFVLLIFLNIPKPGFTGYITLNNFDVNAVEIWREEIILKLNNNGKQDYQIQEINIEECGSYTTPTDLTSGSSLTVIISCIPELQGSSFKSDITVVYKESGTEFTSSGTISGKIRS